MYRQALSRATASSPLIWANAIPAGRLHRTAGACGLNRFYTQPTQTIPPAGSGSDSGSKGGPGRNFNPGVPDPDQKTGSQYTKHSSRTADSDSGSDSNATSSDTGKDDPKAKKEPKFTRATAWELSAGQGTSSGKAKYSTKATDPSIPTSQDTSKSNSGKSDAGKGGPGKDFNPGVPSSDQSTGSQYAKSSTESTASSGKNKSSRDAKKAPYSTSAAGPTPPPPGTPPPPPPKGNIIVRYTKTAFRWTALLAGSSVVGLLVLTGGIFVHDAFTYSERHAEKVPVSPLALNPELGGPKNLPIAKVSMSDDENDEYRKLAEKPRLVILGSGWGVSSFFGFCSAVGRRLIMRLQAVGVLQKLKPGDYHVTVIAPDTFMVQAFLNRAIFE